MKSSTRWILYSLFRVGLFAAAFLAMVLLGLELWMAAIVATLVAFAISYIFFSEPRKELARDLESRHRGVSTDKDNDIENTALDNAEYGAALNSAEFRSAPDAAEHDDANLKHDHRGES